MARDGVCDFALGIQELADVGCDVIVDDVCKCLYSKVIFLLHATFKFQLFFPYLYVQPTLISHFSRMVSIPSQQIMWLSKEVSPTFHQQGILASIRGKAKFLDLENLIV